ncbi:chromosome partitioning protein ParA [Vibrio sp. 10N.286.49.C2]|uniref:chromosome partitioning protein ParA n=1 Tax=unclassified Vibrio TaxID=2614977 RepID=UPI000C815710|nr:MULTISPECIES: chromosome partitioning protein ParA [unclassified Vibrio]PMH37268.1 chromosome partitioning protein ParA [Vibrio sp. 10N.286.49.C2]PMH57413.1 chromosome partitioning protein ParA [Vibrio sp. 10N.286.49.B1]PMH80726.1 chromosome partitioning protein ParA [Vibrio sp. 10N.286.48.B7]
MENKTENQQHDEEVVVIEQKDKRARLYIGIAAALGLAAGGLIGATITQNDWQQRYKELDTRYQNSLQVTQKHDVALKDQLAQADSDAQLKLRKAVESKVEAHQVELEQLNDKVAKLEKDNKALQGQVANQKQAIVVQEEKNTKLVRKTDIQSSMFEQSQELFKRESELKTEVAVLEQEKSKLLPESKSLKKDCDLFLEGTSWDAKSDSCDRNDKVNSRLSQIDQMLKVHNMDLNHIATLKQELGIQ